MYRTVLCAFTVQWFGVCLAAQPTPIGILFDFSSQPEFGVVDLMKTEIREILAPTGVPIVFQRVGTQNAAQPFRKIVVVHFRGACQSQLDADVPNSLDHPALGKTAVAAGRVIPDVQVFCNEVRAYVPSVSRTPFVQMYGRALGRVVTHELYHALLSTREHARSGVARFTQSSRDLTRDKLELDARSIAQLRAMYGE